MSQRVKKPEVNPVNTSLGITGSAGAEAPIPAQFGSREYLRQRLTLIPPYTCSTSTLLLVLMVFVLLLMLELCTPLASTGDVTRARGTGIFNGELSSCSS